MTLKQPITNYVHAWLLSLQKRPRRWPSPKRRSSSAIRCPAHPLPSWKLLLPIATLHYCDGSQLGSSACPHTATWNLAVLASSWLCITLGILSSHGGWGPPDRGKWKFQHHTQSASRVGRRFGGCSCHSQILPEKQSPPFLAQSSKGWSCLQQVSEDECPCPGDRFAEVVPGGPRSENCSRELLEKTGRVQQSLQQLCNVQKLSFWGIFCNDL